MCHAGTNSDNRWWLVFEVVVIGRKSKTTEESASPEVLKVKAELLGFPELDKTSYMNWKVNDEKPTSS